MSEQTTNVPEPNTVDPVIPGQNYVCLSFIKVKENNEEKGNGAIKIRGVYSSLEEAEARAKHLQEIDKSVHIFVGLVGHWLPSFPDPVEIERKEYAEDYMQNLMKEYEKHQKLMKESNYAV
jgi:hypothetical protein